MFITTLVNDCFQAFQIELDQYNSDLDDELGRFKVWAGNISAHRPALSRRSLEYRLRDSSSLRGAVILLLNELMNTLDHLSTFGRVVATPDFQDNATITK